MKFFAGIIITVVSLNLNAQIIDTTNNRVVKPVKTSIPAEKVERSPVRSDIRINIFGEYTIDSYAILSKKTPATEELNALIGTLVKVQAAAITGTVIDPMTFNIYEVEHQRRDDFIFRVFGREIKAPEPDLPESFNVHKTDNANCYGIVEINHNEIAIPYKGVLLFLKKK